MISMFFSNSSTSKSSMRSQLLECNI